MLLVVCMFSGKTWYWITIGVFFPWKKYFFCSQSSLGTCSSLSSFEVWWFIHFGMSTGVFLFQLMLVQLCWWDFMGIASEIVSRTGKEGNVFICDFFCCLISQYWETWLYTVFFLGVHMCMHAYVCIRWVRVHVCMHMEVTGQYQMSSSITLPYVLRQTLPLKSEFIDGTGLGSVVPKS